MDAEKLLSAVNNFKNKKIAVVGDFVIDKYSYGIVERLNPEASHAILLRETREKMELGCAGNVAANLASLGAETHFFTIIGKDYFDKLCPIFLSKKISLNCVKGEMTIVKHRIISEHPFHYFLRLDFEEKSTKHPEDLLNGLMAMVNEFRGDAIVLSDYDKGIFSSGLAARIISLAKLKGIPCFVAPKPKNAISFAGADLILPNQKEAWEIAGIISHELRDLFEEIKTKMGYKSVMITLGEKGIAVRENGEIFIAPTRVQQVADVTGAGDTVLAATTLGIVSGLSLKECAHIANYAAGIVIEKIGAATASPTELIERIKKDSL